MRFQQPLTANTRGAPDVYPNSEAKQEHAGPAHNATSDATFVLVRRLVVPVHHPCQSRFQASWMLSVGCPNRLKTSLLVIGLDVCVFEYFKE